ncbi:hypothetical protein CCUS01_00688, partial [Colletotrichum cuscutae]
RTRHEPQRQTKRVPNEPTSERGVQILSVSVPTTGTPSPSPVATKNPVLRKDAKQAPKSTPQDSRLLLFSRHHCELGLAGLGLLGPAAFFCLAIHAAYFLFRDLASRCPSFHAVNRQQRLPLLSSTASLGSSLLFLQLLSVSRRSPPPVSPSTFDSTSISSSTLVFSNPIHPFLPIPPRSFDSGLSVLPFFPQSTAIHLRLRFASSLHRFIAPILHLTDPDYHSLFLL